MNKPPDLAALFYLELIDDAGEPVKVVPFSSKALNELEPGAYKLVRRDAPPTNKGKAGTG